MADEIRPALSADEWAHYGGRQGVVGRGYDGGKTLLELFGGAGGDVAVWDLRVLGAQPALIGDPATKHAAVALLNAALPDGDPRKLTPEDAAAVLFGAVALERTFAEHADGEQVAATLNRVFHKLAAILPPPPDVPRT